ncbi:MAG TPA: SagB/ThcOx family dehydrogenase [Desulfomonilaceae bacterium]|nr:SagB/ThcOx family dehydrogenase [Desulfomonilaceae bacterium]
MKRKLLLALSLVAAFSLGTAAIAEDLKAVKLPEPQLTIGKPLMEVLRTRQSYRDFSDQTLPAQTLSNLLWAACGINRPDSGKRTAPSARNKQEIDVYVATAQSLFLYEAKTHSLQLVLSQDIRAATGTQDYVKNAPVNLVYVADFSRMTEPDDASKIPLAFADTGFISENVYLYCASERLATVVRALIDRDKLAAIMKLRPEQKITLAQSVGLPQSK